MKTTLHDKQDFRSAFFDLRKNVTSPHLDLKGFWSYPAFLPGVNGEVYWLYLILPTALMPKKRVTLLFSPKASVITKANSKQIVRYDNFTSGRNPFTEEAVKPKYTFPHKSISGLTSNELIEKEKTLLEMSESESHAFATDRKLSEGFRKAWLGIIHPIFLLYLRHLTPDFFRALAVEQTG